MVAVTGRLSGRDLGFHDPRRAVGVGANRACCHADVTFVLGGAYAAATNGVCRGLLAGARRRRRRSILPAAAVRVREFPRRLTAILFTTLLALPVVFLGLWATSTELNITSMMGLTMIVGIATEVSIFLVSEIDELPPGPPESRP